MKQLQESMGDVCDHPGIGPLTIIKKNNWGNGSYWQSHKMK